MSLLPSTRSIPGAVSAGLTYNKWQTLDETVNLMLPDKAFQSRGSWLIAGSALILAAFAWMEDWTLAEALEKSKNVAINHTAETPQTGLAEANLVIGRSHRFRVELAITSEQSRKGLMFRTSLPEGRGMLFTFKPPQPVKFWMKNTKIPLDMLFLAQGRVVDIQSDVPPCVKDPCPVYGPNAMVDMVVELPAGTVRRKQIVSGDTVELEEPLAGMLAPNVKAVSRDGK
jgi:uncharacterized protein